MGIPLRGGLVALPDARRTEYWEFPPPAGLAHAVALTWEGRPGWRRRLRVLPDGCADLVWDGRRLLVSAAQAGPLRVAVGEDGTSVGVRLRPGLAGTLIRCPASELDPGPVPLRLLRGPEIRPLEDRLRAADGPAARRRVLEHGAGRLLEAGPEPDVAVLEAARRLAEGPPGVERVAAAVGLTPRELRRRFHAQVGYGPKALERVLRFQRFVRRLEAIASGRSSLAGIAAWLGYADQAHLGRECLRLSGSTPGALVSRWAAAAETF